MKLATLNVLKIFVFCVLILTVGDSTQNKLIKVGEIKNEIRLGQLAGNRNLEVGVKNILEELLLDQDYDLSDKATTQVNIKLVFFDVKNVGKNIGVFHNNESITQIIAVGELVEDGKVKKKTTQKSESKEISTSTLVVASDGTFNQQNASIAIKKVCEQIVNELVK